MRSTVEVYENNAGGIYVAVFGKNGPGESIRCCS